MESINDLLRHTKAVIHEVNEDFEKHHLKPTLNSDLSRLISHMESLAKLAGEQNLKVKNTDMIDQIKASVKKLRDAHGKDLQEEIAKIIPNLNFPELIQAFDDGLEKLKNDNLDKSKVGRKGKADL